MQQQQEELHHRHQAEIDENASPRHLLPQQQDLPAPPCSPRPRRKILTRPHPSITSKKDTELPRPEAKTEVPSPHTKIRVFPRQGTPSPFPSPSPFPECIPAHVHLPHDLIISNIVASRLPLLDLIRARAVCRTWRDSIFSPIIAEDFLSNPNCHRPQLLVEHSSHSGPSLAAYDPYLNHWFVIPTPSFRHLVAASSGLFCYVTEDGWPPSLVVGNPLTNQWRHLPSIPLGVPAYGPQIVGMTADAVAGSYKVMVLFGRWGDDANAYLPFMYDSTAGSWAPRSAVSARLLFATSRSTVKPPDTLLSVDSNALNLFSYDMTNNTGSMTQLQHLPSLINDEDPKTNLWRRLPQIASCKDALFLVARCLGERAPKCRVGQVPIVLHSSVGVWMMLPSSDNWEFTTRIPLGLLETLVKGSDGTDFIIASNGSSHLFFVLKGSPHMLAYDTSSSSWTLLSGCPADYNSYPLHQNVFYESLLWIAAL